jgi:hypothetical protein
MNNKTPQSKRKIADVTKPDLSSDVKTPQIVIEKRARAVAPDSSASIETPAQEVVPTAATAVKHTTIKPLETTDASAVEVAATPQPNKEVASKPVATAPMTAPAAQTPAPTAPVAAPANNTSPSTAVSTDDIQTEDNQSDIVKEAAAKQQSEAETRRQKQLNEYIDTREFFVPINAAARKRSIEVSLWLTLVYIILSLVLVDLMLDSGMILLLQKVPHTNFFGM